MHISPCLQKRVTRISGANCHDPVMYEPIVLFATDKLDLLYVDWCCRSGEPLRVSSGYCIAELAQFDRHAAYFSEPNVDIIMAKMRFCSITPPTRTLLGPEA